MPTKERTFRELVRRYADSKVRTTPRYRRELVRILNRVATRLESAGMDLGIKKMSDAHVMLVFETAGGSLSNRSYEAEMFRTFLKHEKVVTEPLRMPKPDPERPRISPETFAKLHEAALRAGDVRGAIILLLESLTIRRVGISRLRPEDISQSSVQVLDKGRMGGKPRRIPITPEVWEQLQQYLDWRQRQIMATLQRNPSAAIPRRLIIWTRFGSMGDAKTGALDLYVKKCGARCGVNLSHHMMRRMACRELWEAGERPEVAMKITGHSELETFLTYVGSMDAQTAALMSAMLEKRRMVAQPVRT
jgi:integrase